MTSLSHRRPLCCLRSHKSIAHHEAWSPWACFWRRKPLRQARAQERVASGVLYASFPSDFRSLRMVFGLFSKERSLQKTIEKATNKLAQQPDRWGALEKLRDDGSPDALYG